LTTENLQRTFQERLQICSGDLKARCKSILISYFFGALKRHCKLAAAFGRRLANLAGVLQDAGARFWRISRHTCFRGEFLETFKWSTGIDPSLRSTYNPILNLNC